METPRIPVLRHVAVAVARGAIRTELAEQAERVRLPQAITPLAAVAASEELVGRVAPPPLTPLVAVVARAALVSPGRAGMALAGRIS
ncbi:MAG: hypothetical protein P4L91_06810 [Burkholderiaceae bacterium]|nr:hypothetical protein [Burkholderiaceae bacterium]